ncbi:MAG: hypothetical protein GSR84_01460 [Desulfurococcales archaeon]|nr:hypothetical protein [Desulfurococcales archaeon]
MRGRRGVSELVGTLIAIVIISSLLASAVLIGGEFKRDIRDTVFRASERLVEASNPPKLELLTVNNSLVLRIIPTTPIDVSMIFLSFYNGSTIILNATDDIYEGGQVIIDGYTCEKVRVGVITKLGNIFYYNKPYYDCSVGDNPGSPATGTSVIPYTFEGYRYNQSSISGINNVNIGINLTLDLVVTNSVCRASISYTAGQTTVSSSVSTGREGYSWGRALGPIPLVPGLDLYLAPALYRTKTLCIAGIEFRYTSPSIVQAAIDLDATISVDSTFMENIRNGEVILTPIIYTQQSQSYAEIAYSPDVNEITLNGQASAYSAQTMISDILILAVASIHESQVYNPEIHESITLTIKKVIQGSQAISIHYKDVQGPYKLRLLTPTPQGLGSSLENALVEALWAASQSGSLKVAIDGRETRLGGSPIMSTSSSRIGIIAIQGPELMLNSRLISYAVLYYDASTLTMQVTVSYRTGGNIVTPPPMILVEHENGSSAIIAPYGGQEPTTTGGLSYSVNTTINPGGRLLIAAKLEPITSGISADLSSKLQTQAQATPSPGFYIANEVYTEAGIKMVSAMVILVP